MTGESPILLLLSFCAVFLTFYILYSTVYITCSSACLILLCGKHKRERRSSE